MIGPLPLRLGTAVLLGMALAAASAEPRTPDEVVALVTRAAAHIQVIGAPAAFADFSRRDGGFVDGELYVFCNTASSATRRRASCWRMAAIRSLSAATSPLCVTSWATSRSPRLTESRWRTGRGGTTMSGPIRQPA